MANEVSEEDQKQLQALSEKLSQRFEQAMSDSTQRHYCLRLYIAGTTPRSRQAIASLKSICETHLQGKYELEVIDVYQSAQQMHMDQVMVIPTLIKQLPLPLRRIIGDLSNTEKVLLGLDLVPQ
jgi:circadian clock protein KaiB